MYPETYGKLDLVHVIRDAVVDVALLHVDPLRVAWHEHGLGRVDGLHAAAVVNQILQSVLEVVGEEGRVDGHEALAQVGLATACLPARTKQTLRRCLRRLKSRNARIEPSDIGSVFGIGQDAAQNLDHEHQSESLVAAWKPAISEISIRNRETRSNP